MRLRKVGQFVHQVAERSQWLRRSSGHAFDLVKMFDAVEERRAMPIRIHGDQPFRTGAQPSFRHVQDATHVHVVGGVHDGLQICDGVLDFSAFVEFGASYQLVWQVGVDHRLFQRTRLRVGPVHDGHVAVGDAFLRMQPCDFGCDIAGLLLRVVGCIADDRIAFAECGPQFLRLAVLVLRDHRIRRIQNGLRRTVVLFEHDGLRVREVLFEILDVADVGTAEGVYGLIGVTDDGNPGGSDPARARGMRIGLLARIDAGEFTHQYVLGVIGVLILVHENVTEFVPVIIARLRARSEQFDGAHDQIVEVHGVGLGQTVLVFGVHHGEQFLDVVEPPQLVAALPRPVIGGIGLELVLPRDQ